MKKNYLFLIAAAFAALAISCSKELEGPQQNQEVSNTDPVEITGESTYFTATADETKSAFRASTESVFKVVWNTWKDGEADVVDTVVVNGRKAFDIEVKDDGRSLGFSIADVTAPYFAVVAPTQKSSATGLYGGFDADTQSMNVLVKGPANPQKYVAGTYDPEGIIMAAYNATEPVLNFKHYSTFLQLTVDPKSSDKENVRWVYIRDGEGDYLAGTWKLDFSNPDAVIIEPYNMTNPIAYYCGKDGIPAGAPMYIAIPAYNYKKGLIITVKDVKNHFSSFKVKPENADFSGKAGKITRMNVLLDPKPGVINSAEDWEEFVKFTKTAKYKNDYDIYKWVGDGTVRIGQDFTFTEEQTRLTGMDRKGLEYDLDGGGHTITFNCNTRYALFGGLRATVKDLNIDAKEGHYNVGVNGSGSAFVDTLYTGGKIINCTNNMPLKMSNNGTPMAIGGIVKANYGGDIEKCTNNGKITGESQTSVFNVQKSNIYVGGIVAVMGSYSSLGYNDITLKDCKNNGEISITPVCTAISGNDNGFVIFGVGGIAGWVRLAKDEDVYKRTFENCDNTADINLYGTRIASPDGLHTASVSVGGIVGIASRVSTSNGALVKPTGTNGIKTYFVDCDNSGKIYNCVTNYSNSSESNTKVYTSGLIGSIMGYSDCHAVVDNCTNTGAVVPYDLVTSDVLNPSVRTAYCSVVSGLIGFCGYVDIKNSTVCCKVGTTKRPVVAIGGITAWAMRPLIIDNCKSYIEGSFTRLGSYKFNRALVVNVPAKNGNNTDMSPAPSMTGSKITNSYADWQNTTSSNTMSNASDTSDQTSNLTTIMDYAPGNLVYGQGYTDATTKQNDWGTIGCSKWTDHPLPAAN